VYASSVAVGDCIMTVSGMEEVSGVETVQGQGLYTIVTGEEYVVVNGIIASPFAFNHMMANMYYNIHRFVYACVPVLLTSRVFRSANEVRCGTQTSRISRCICFSTVLRHGLFRFLFVTGSLSRSFFFLLLHSFSLSLSISSYLTLTISIIFHQYLHFRLLDS
jgi:hypothetical protein